LNCFFWFAYLRALDIDLTILSGLPSRREPLRKPMMVIGRAAEADIILNHPEISRRHCQLSFEMSSWVIEDLGSQSGTIVNDVRISKKTLLKLGDQIVLGPITLGFGQNSGPGPNANEPLGIPGTIIFRKRVVQSVPLSDRLGPNGFRVVDLRTGVGSFVIGRPFDEHPLVIGDHLQLGPFYFVFTGDELKRVQRVSAGKTARRLQVLQLRSVPSLEASLLAMQLELRTGWRSVR
jgi:pSer/pThr/pTyr-binding forkhead associated (FHA) protein